jgi:four helix bundle protein
MEKIKQFEDLDIWKESMITCIKIYKLMENCRDFSFKDQIQRAAVSVPSNIAEGFERQTTKEFVQFLYIAKGSCGEFRTQLYLTNRLKYIEQDIFVELLDKTKHISSMIYNFIKSIKARN